MHSHVSQLLTHKSYVTAAAGDGADGLKALIVGQQSVDMWLQHGVNALPRVARHCGPVVRVAICVKKDNGNFRWVAVDKSYELQQGIFQTRK